MRSEMAYIVQMSLNGKPQIKSGYTLSDDLNVVRDMYLALIKNTSEAMERAYPGMVIKSALKPDGTLREGISIMAKDGADGHQGDVHTVELHELSGVRNDCCNETTRASRRLL
jgi:hypothetical protein